jgi:hypothetical protein
MMPTKGRPYSKVWAAVYLITGLVFIVVGAVRLNLPLVLLGVLIVPFGIGLDVFLRRRRMRSLREPVRRV